MWSSSVSMKLAGTPLALPPLPEDDKPGVAEDVLEKLLRVGSEEKATDERLTELAEIVVKRRLETVLGVDYARAEFLDLVTQ